MEFQEIYAELLGGKTLKLSFVSVDELHSFKNSFVVYFHRCTKRLKDCGMAAEYDQFSLRFKIHGRMVQITYAKKEKRKYDFVILKDDDSSNEAGS